MPELVHSSPMYLRMRQQLRSEILSGKFQPGERLGTEDALMDRFQVSRVTVRKALVGLVGEGLIRRVPGGGTFVTRRQTRTLITRPRTGHVALQAPDLHTTLSDAMREIMRGISSVLDAAGVSTSLFLTRPEDTHAPSNSVFFQALSEHRVDGVISTYYVGREGYLRMLELGMPLVLTFDYDGLDLPLACVDSLHLFEEVASLVVEAGWRLPALVKGPGLSRTEELTGADSPLTGFRAVEGFRSGLVRHGLPHHPSHVIRSNYRPEEAGGLAAEVRRLAPEPDVLIVDGVEIASALRELLPHRIAVVGLGPRSGPPGIGVVEVPSYQIGRKAAEMLRRRMDAPTAPVEQEYIRLDVAKARASVFSAYERLVGRHATPQA